MWPFKRAERHARPDERQDRSDDRQERRAEPNERRAARIAKRSRAVVAHIDPSVAYQRSRKGAKMIDVRSAYEFRLVHARGARHVPPKAIRAGETGLHPDDDVIVICATGHRSEHQAKKLAKAGFKRVASVNGGLNAWQAAGLPVKRGPGRR